MRRCPRVLVFEGNPWDWRELGTYREPGLRLSNVLDEIYWKLFHLHRQRAEESER